MKNVFLIIGGLFFLNSCQFNEKEKEKNTYEIISLLIDKAGRPIKPPPPPEGQEPFFTTNQIDSIMKQSQDVALFPVLEQEKKRFVKDDSYGEKFNNLLKKLATLNDEVLIDISKIEVPKAFKLDIVDTLLLKSDKRHINKNYDILIYFSNISFSDNYTKAVLSIGTTRGYLNGSSAIVFLEKKDGVWKIVYSKEYEIS